MLATTEKPVKSGTTKRLRSSNFSSNSKRPTSSYKQLSTATTKPSSAKHLRNRPQSHYSISNYAETSGYAYDMPYDSFLAMNTSQQSQSGRRTRNKAPASSAPILSSLAILEAQCNRKKLIYLEREDKRRQQLQHRLNQQILKEKSLKLEATRNFDRRDHNLRRKSSFMNTTHDFYVEQSLDYERRKVEAQKVREKLSATKQRYMEIDSKIMMDKFEKNRKKIEEKSQILLENKKNESLLKAEVVSNRRKSVESVKEQQIKYLDKIFKDQLSQVLRNKAQIDNRRAEGFKKKVFLHDLEIDQKRQTAKLMHVG